MIYKAIFAYIYLPAYRSIYLSAGLRIRSCESVAGLPRDLYLEKVALPQDVRVSTCDSSHARDAICDTFEPAPVTQSAPQASHVMRLPLAAKSENKS